jgi:cytochrome c-type biogenesis protein CcmH
VRRAFFLAALALAFAVAAPALASEQRPTLAEVESELYCPTCHEPLAASSSPIANRMRAFIRDRIGAGDTKSEIKAKLVRQFGEGVLAAPPARGFNLLAWLLPLVGAAAAVVAVGVLARRWLRARADEPSPDPSRNGRPPIDPELERRLDEELARFES